MKNTRSADFCANRIDVITNFAVITNVVIKRVHHINKKMVLIFDRVYTKFSNSVCFIDSSMSVSFSYYCM